MNNVHKEDKSGTVEFKQNETHAMFCFHCDIQIKRFVPLKKIRNRRNAQDMETFNVVISKQL